MDEVGLCVKSIPFGFGFNQGELEPSCLSEMTCQASGVVDEVVEVDCGLLRSSCRRFWWIWEVCGEGGWVVWWVVWWWWCGGGVVWWCGGVVVVVVVWCGV